jgi:hypothetical protein
MFNNNEQTLFTVCLIILAILGILGLVHLIFYFTTKLVIWIALGLFNVDWHGKFWLVYGLVFLISGLTGSNRIRINR